MLKLLSKSAIAAVFLASAGGSAVAEQGDQSCPVSWTQLRWAMTSAARPTKQHFWGVVVNRSGTVCAVAFSGSMATDQWLLSRQIAAAKAFTSNGLSLDNSVAGANSGQRLCWMEPFRRHKTTADFTGFILAIFKMRMML